jgi:hypothetical protein
LNVMPATPAGESPNCKYGEPPIVEMCNAVVEVGICADFGPERLKVVLADAFDPLLRFTV